MGLLDVQEPFERLFTQGMITARRARRCPSPRATSFSPAPIVERYGADTARCYILFIGPPDQDADWSRRRRRGRAPLPRRACGGWAPTSADAGRRRRAGPPTTPRATTCALLRKAHWAIDKVTHDLAGRFAFNTAIAAVMELVNEVYRPRARPQPGALRFAPATAASLIFPFAPHTAPTSTSG